MKYKELAYKDELKDFSLSIGLSLFCFLAVFVGMILEGVSIYNSFLSSIVLTVILFLVVMISNIKKYNFYKKNQNIKQNGRRINGYISSFEYNVTRGKYQRAEYCLIVNYVDPTTGVNCLYKTPCVNFDIFNDLGSRNCSIYILNNDIYVSDFVRRMSNDKYVWEDNIISQYNPQKLVKDASMERLKTTTIVLVIVILVIILSGLLV